MDEDGCLVGINVKSGPSMDEGGGVMVWKNEGKLGLKEGWLGWKRGSGGLEEGKEVGKKRGSGG